jgi:hypothetical protein
MRNTQELREFLIANMLKVASGEQSATVARGVCAYAQQVYNTLHIEAKYKLAGPVEPAGPIAL